MNSFEKYLAYPWALLYGIDYYLLFQIVNFVRFDRFNWSFSILEFMLYVVGVASVLLTLFLYKKLEGKLGALIGLYLLATPFSYIGALMGGLIGAPGILIFGMVPYVVVLGVGFFILLSHKKKASGNSTME